MVYRKLMMGSALAFALSLAAAPSWAQTGPAAPQQPGQLSPLGDGGSAPDGINNNSQTSGSNDRLVDIVPGASLFVDPTGGNFSAGPCRYVSVSSSAPNPVVLAISTPAEWSDDISTAGGANGEAMEVCCRPTTTQLCASASGGTQNVTIKGAGADSAGTTGYALQGGGGTATASCSNPPYGSYTETATFQCGVAGSGTGADGLWSGKTSDSDACVPNSYTVTNAGNCSAGCGGGHEYQSIYNSCGQLQSQGYTGPACNTQSCCTPNASVGTCSASCGGGTQTVYDSCGNPTGSQGCNTQSCAPVAVDGVCDPAYASSSSQDFGAGIFAYCVAGDPVYWGRFQPTDGGGGCGDTDNPASYNGAGDAAPSNTTGCAPGFAACGYPTSGHTYFACQGRNGGTSQVCKSSNIWC